MLTLQRINVFNFENAFHGMRNPMASWEKSDSGYVCTPNRTTYFATGDNVEEINISAKSKYVIGPNDLALAQKLIGSKTNDHSKFLRQIMVSMYITAPLYWWKEMDQYRIGVTTNSESTMHRLAKTPITMNCFSFDEELSSLSTWEPIGSDYCENFNNHIQNIINICEAYRKTYIETKDTRYWRALIQLLPSSWNQMRHWTANYAVLRNIYTSRRSHKLAEWRTFCEGIEKLPYGKELITFGVKKDE